MLCYDKPLPVHGHHHRFQCTTNIIPLNCSIQLLFHHNHISSWHILVSMLQTVAIAAKGIVIGIAITREKDDHPMIIIVDSGQKLTEKWLRLDTEWERMILLVASSSNI